MYIGSSSEAQTLRISIEKARKSSFPVLIIGETGTGKGVVARALHGDSPAPFVKIDCASLVPSLVESELHGYVRGAFTGAQTDKMGLLAAANGGTLFLDEVGELTPELQSKFLNVLQDRETRPVGSVKTKPFKCRIISATNRELSAEVKEGRFRTDLFYRLKIITIRVPPLRRHLEDIPELVQHFLNRHAERHQIVSREVMERLLGHRWPGNIRELESCVQAMCAMSSGTALSLTNAPSQLLSAGLSAVHSKESLRGLNRHITKDRLEEMIEVIGSKAQAARALGIGRSTVYRRLAARCGGPAETNS